MAREIGGTTISATTLFVIGLVLFLFPEPATSTLGVFLMALGVLLYFMSW
ncbi:hypothetical protein ACFO0N_03320 [Halobium salinum]|uniref:Uncharacterized protein n=1 Tax=Halobium salinum TaxID=1364940 RepID=A0ABD5P7W8_9EURY|nr:hypothetical protein [Halobium salinum]